MPIRLDRWSRWCKTAGALVVALSLAALAGRAQTSTYTRSLNNVRYANAFAGADACAKVNAAIVDLPSTGGTVHADGFLGTQACATNPFSGVTKTGTLILGNALYQVSSSWVIPSGWTIRGSFGGTPSTSSVVAPSKGTVLKWVGSAGAGADPTGTNSGLPNYVIDETGGIGVNLEGFSIDCGLTAYVDGIHINSTNSPANFDHVIRDGYIGRCQTGMVFGHGDDNQADHTLVENVMIQGGQAGSEGIHFTDANTQDVTFINVRGNGTDIGFDQFPIGGKTGPQYAIIKDMSWGTPFSSPADIGISSISSTSDAVSVTTSASHGLLVDEIANIMQTGSATLNGTCRVASVADPTHFTCVVYGAGTQGPLTAGYIRQDISGFLLNGGTNITIETGVVMSGAPVAPLPTSHSIPGRYSIHLAKNSNQSTGYSTTVTGFAGNDPMMIESSSRFISIGNPVGGPTGPAITSIIGSGTTATVTTTTPHGLAVNDLVDIVATADYNGTYQVTGVTSSTVFTVASASNASDGAGGNIQLQLLMANGSAATVIISIGDTQSAGGVVNEGWASSSYGPQMTGIFNSTESIIRLGSGGNLPSFAYGPGSALTGAIRLPADARIKFRAGAVGSQADFNGLSIYNTSTGSVRVGDTPGAAFLGNLFCGNAPCDIGPSSMPFRKLYLTGAITSTESAALSGVASSDLLWGDSTAHRLKMNNNNGGAVTIAATSGDTFTSTTLTSPTVNGTPTGTGIPTLTLKTGSGGGNYTNATTSYTVADATNLCYTITIPTGWKLGISVSGALATATAAVVAQAALTDNAACSTANAGILVETAPLQGAGIGVADAFALDWVITGDGASHKIALQFKTSNVADTASLVNSSSTVTPTMKFELMPSN